MVLSIGNLMALISWDCLFKGYIKAMCCSHHFSWLTFYRTNCGESCLCEKSLMTEDWSLWKCGKLDSAICCQTPSLIYPAELNLQNKICPEIGKHVCKMCCMHIVFWQNQKKSKYHQFAKDFFQISFNLVKYFQWLFFQNFTNIVVFLSI